MTSTVTTIKFTETTIEFMETEMKLLRAKITRHMEAQKIKDFQID